MAAARLSTSPSPLHRYTGGATPRPTESPSARTSATTPIFHVYKMVAQHCITDSNDGDRRHLSVGVIYQTGTYTDPATGDRSAYWAPELQGGPSNGGYLVDGYGPATYEDDATLIYPAHRTSIVNFSAITMFVYHDRTRETAVLERGAFRLTLDNSNCGPDGHDF